MKISQKDWNNYIKKISLLDKKAASLIKTWVDKNGLDDRDSLIGYTFDVVNTLSLGTGSLAARWYDAIAEIEGVYVASAEMAELPTYGEVAKTINGVLKRSLNTDTIASAASLLVKRTAADTTLHNAKRDGAEFAWIPVGDTCPFCLQLASYGWRRASDKTVKGDHAEHIHANCDCEFAIRFGDDLKYSSYDPDKYKEMFENAEGDTIDEKRNSIRRMQYQENKDVINAQKRAAYAERQNKNNDLQSIMMDNPRNFPQRDYVNDENTVNSILSKMSYDNNDEELKQYVRHSIGMMEEREFKLLDDVDVRIVRTEENNAFVKIPQIDENGHKVYTIKINPDDLMEFGFAHEYSHLASEELNLVKDKEFSKVLENVAKSIEAIQPALIENDINLYAVVKSPLFVDPYQGRTYIVFGKNGPEKTIKTESLVEYISTGYEYYLGDPNLLENKDKVLYNYFKKRGLGK